MTRFNPFANPTKAEIEAKAKAIVESLKKVQDLKDAARICLKLPEFIVYLDKAKRMDETLTQLALSIDMFDPAQLWRLQSLQSELKAIRGIITVEKDAK